MRALIALVLIAAVSVAAPVPKSIKKKPVASPDGAWVLVDFDSDGKGGSAQNMARDWVIEGEYLHIGTRQQWATQPKGAPNFTIVDPDRPNLRLWGRNPATFEVDGDTLRACYAHDGRKELTECKPQMGVHYYVFQRVK